MTLHWTISESSGERFRHELDHLVLITITLVKKNNLGGLENSTLLNFIILIHKKVNMSYKKGGASTYTTSPYSLNLFMLGYLDKYRLHLLIITLKLIINSQIL